MIILVAILGWYIIIGCSIMSETRFYEDWGGVFFPIQDDNSEVSETDSIDKECEIELVGEISHDHPHTRD